MSVFSSDPSWQSSSPSHFQRELIHRPLSHINSLGLHDGYSVNNNIYQKQACNNVKKYVPILNPSRKILNILLWYSISNSLLQGPISYPDTYSLMDRGFTLANLSWGSSYKHKFTASCELLFLPHNEWKLLNFIEFQVYYHKTLGPPHFWSVIPANTEKIVPLFNGCWASLADSGPTLIQQWDNVSCLLRYHFPLD